MEVLNRKIKKAGFDFAKVCQKTSGKREVLERELEQIVQEANQTGTFLPWEQAVEMLHIKSEEQILLCVLWSLKSAGEIGMKIPSFRTLLLELALDFLENMEKLPPWILYDQTYVCVSDVLYNWLEGESPKLPDGAEFLLPKKQMYYGLDDLLEEGEQIFRQIEKFSSPLALCVCGEKGSGRQFYFEQLCASQNMALLLIDSRKFQDRNRDLNACVLCSKLYGAFVCVRINREDAEKFLQHISECFGFYGIIRDEKQILTEDIGASLIMRNLTSPDKICRRKMAEDILGEMLPKAQIDQLIKMQFPAGLFLRFLKNIKSELIVSEGKLESHLILPVSANLRILPTTRTFEELKLPKPQYEKLRALCRMIAVQREVVEDWGFGKKFSYGNGVSLLFYGAPGTGKTMAAQVMANKLGLPLYQVDLSQLISKYIGETQKNIGRIFEEAGKCDCILLFDEADAIFAKRSEVSDAQDRYSNAETAYLLQRIEQYEGVCILATNLLQNFDEAFRRRISYMVHFPMPDVSLRKELWEEIFPKNTPVSSNVDALALAQAFELSGASIKNAAFHAAMMARADGAEVGMAYLLKGIQNEYEKQGRSISSSQRELIEAFHIDGGENDEG